MHLITRQIVGSDQASTLLDRVGQFTRHRAMVKVVGIVSDALQRFGQLGLLEYLPWLIVVAVTLENAVRFGKLRQIGIAKGPGLVVFEDEAIARQPDRGLHHLLQREFAPMLLGISQSCHGAGHGDRFVAK